MIEGFLFDFDGGIIFLEGHLLVKDVLDIMGAVGVM